MLTTAIDRAAGLLRGDNGVPFGKCESASLRLEKFVRLGDNTKKEEIAAVVAKTARPIPKFTPPNAVTFVAKLGGRLIVNQAGGVLENAGLCLHPHFNGPYIPGSALKGVARHAAWCAWNDESDAAKKDALAEEIAEIFGYPTGDSGLDDFLAERGKDQAQSGSVCFMSAHPDQIAKIVVDIVNCHHPKYYAGDEDYGDAPDTESPNPQFFPAVEKDALFVFSIAPIKAGANVERARWWLMTAITENGVGAKTSAGYGWFSYDEETNKRWLKAQEVECIKGQVAAKLQNLISRIEAFEAETAHLTVLDEAQCGRLDELGGDGDGCRGAKGALENLEGLAPSQVPLRQRYEECVRRCRLLDGKRPRLSLEEQIRRAWDVPSIREQVLTPYIQLFGTRDRETQATVVKVLRTHPLWQYLRRGDFRDLGRARLIRAVNAEVANIRAFARTTAEGRMP